ncbi:hypothetical protein VTN77DRAFT_5019 [Rasamsonia byssochlamydoides]|uniref:uncharacterized protein n=1 Tax=Rasamsonia byssochlamydoides TaxID=89139 RepID=UPI003743B8D8
MASPAKGELFLGLSNSELKLIVLGVLYNDAGKIDYEKVAEKGGYTKGSAQVLYRKALRKLMELNGFTETNASGDAAVSTPVATPAKAKGSAKKRKAAVDAVSDDSPDAPATPDTADDTPTKPKRQQKTPAKKATGKNGARAKKEETDVKETNGNAIKNEPHDDDDDDDAATIVKEQDGDATVADVD